MILVDGLTYYEVKLRAGLFGGPNRSDRLTEAQRRFIGLLEPEHGDESGAWVPAAASSHIEEKQLELAALLDTMPGYFALTRRILEDE